LDVDPLAAPVVQRRSPRRRPAARPGHRPTTSRLGRRLTDTQHKIASLVSAIESGIEPTLLGQQLATRSPKRIESYGRSVGWNRQVLCPHAKSAV
jgi:hypothetical protein